MSEAEATQFCNLLQRGLLGLSLSADAVKMFLTGKYLHHPFSLWTQESLRSLGMWWENLGVDNQMVPMWFKTKSGNTKRLANNNAPNLLNYPEYCLPMAKRWHLLLLNAARPRGTKRNAFLYIVANQVTLHNHVIAEPALLLLKHTHNHSTFGVPGGQQDANDNNSYRSVEDGLLVTALREFAEEVLAIEGDGARTKQIQACNHMRTNVASDPIEPLNVTDNMAAFKMRVPDSFAFETFAAGHNRNINPKASRDTKQNTHISKEMSGYAWVTKSAIENAVNAKPKPRVDVYGNLLVKDTRGHELPVRNWTLGRMKDGNWTPNSILDKIFS